MANQPIPLSGIAGTGNPTGAILPIGGTGGTTPTPAQSGYGNPTGGGNYGPTVSNPYGWSTVNGVITPNSAPANSGASGGGANMQVNPVTGQSTSAPFGSSASGVPYGSPGSNNPNPAGGGPVDQYGNQLSEEGAYRQAFNQAQSEISSITSYYGNLLRQDQQQNKRDTDATRAMNLASGVAGGGAAVANQGATTDNNNKRLAATQAEMAAALEAVYGQINQNAMSIAQQAHANAEDAIKHQQDIAASATKAAQAIGATGMNGTMYQQADPQGFQQLLQQTGLSPFQLISTINGSIPAQYQPQSSVHYAPDADGNTNATVITTQLNPITGAVTFTQSDPMKISIPWTNFDQANVLKLANGDYGYVDSSGRLVDLSTGKPYIPTYQGQPVNTSGATGGIDFSQIDPEVISKGDTPVSQFGGLTYNALLNNAKLYLAQNGKMPSLGLGSAADTKAARFAIQNMAGQISNNLGLDINQISAAYAANKKGITDIVDRVAKIETTSGALQSQFPRLAQLADEVSSAGIKITESDLQATQAQLMTKFGSDAAASYVELINTVRGDYAAMQASLAGGRGGQFFAETAAEAIPLGLTSSQYLAQMQTIEQSSKNAIAATQQEANDLVNNYTQSGGSEATSSNASSSDATDVSGFNW